MNNEFTMIIIINIITTIRKYCVQQTWMLNGTLTRKNRPGGRNYDKEIIMLIIMEHRPHW